MKKLLLSLHLLVSLGYLSRSYSQPRQTDQKMSVEARLAKARAAKAEKKVSKTTRDPHKANSESYKAPVNKVLKGPNGEVVRTGERGAKYYINKNGNKTYLSSNQ